MIVVVSDDARWVAPLEAMLAVRGADARFVDDVLDAVAEVRAGGVTAVVVHVRAGSEDDTRLAVRSLRRRARTTTWVGVVPELPGLSIEDASWTAPNAFAYAELVDAVLGATHGSPEGAEDPDANPLATAELEALLTRCRTESYFALLDVRRDADDATVQHFADQWLARLDATRRATDDAEVRAGVDEAIEAVSDARDVLCSPTARAMYAG